MARPNRSGASRVTCPQELIELILGKTDSADKETLKSCALVARSFRPASQKLIFSDLTIPFSGRDSIVALQRLADVLSASLHLALYVRTLHLVQPGFYEPSVWMRSDIFPAVLSVFTKLESLQTNARLFSLLRCLPVSLESASFLNVFAENSLRDAQNSASAELRLTSLHLDSYAPALFHWAIRAVDLNWLRHLHTMVEENTIDVVQELVDGAIYVETYHLSFGSIFSFDKNPILEKMQGLRTLKITVSLDWDEIEELEGQGWHNPLNDAMRTLDMAPHTIEHLVLNLNIWNPDQLFHFMQSTALENLGEDRSALRDVVVRIVSRYDYTPALQHGIRYLEGVFYQLHNRGMLTVVTVRPEGN
ncbi:hypothetical protein B0H14DRAFT_3595219 [Mycena olivaceomarginata]|nr:hypothetical protein B0H14DRAFT_3595219 [Mycena olivaceomarginata]